MTFFLYFKVFYYNQCRISVICQNFSITKLVLNKMECDIEAAKKMAAYKAIDDNVENCMIVGIGSGSTIAYAVDRLAEHFRNKLKVRCVSTSNQSKQLIAKHELPMVDILTISKLDVYFDGVDEMDDDMILLKGGRACLLVDKIIAYNSDKTVVVGDYTKKSHLLGQKWKKGIPLEVVPLCYVQVKNKVEKMLGGECVLRMDESKSGPCVTDNRNYVLDWKDFDVRADWRKVNLELIQIPGLIETGLFVDMTDKAYFGMKDGTIMELQADPRVVTRCKKCQEI